MTYISNLFNLPLLIVIWLIEAYLFLASARLIVARIPSARQTYFYQNLKLLVDFVPEALRRKLAKWKDKSIPSWLAWFIVMLSGFILRQALIVIVTT
jgi:uncharacterized protein YggT (Ycf19 family)